MAADGSLYMLEINPNCSVFYPDNDGATADIILMMDGYGKKKFLQTMIGTFLVIFPLSLSIYI